MEYDKKKIVAIFALAALAPIFILAILFYGNPNKNYTYSLEKESAEVSLNKNIFLSPLKLIPRIDFVKKYTPSSARLPATSIEASLLGFLKSDTSSPTAPTRNWSAPSFESSASSAVAIEASSGKILYQKNEVEIRPIASLTKLMTALVASEHLGKDEIVTISSHAIETPENFAHLVPGEQLTVEQLLYALLLESSNDSAVALEEFYNSTRKTENVSFVYLMNQKASNLGVHKTHFAEPSGLDAQNQSSALDIAKILIAAFKKEDLSTIIKTPSYTTTSIDNEVTHLWVTSNNLITQNENIIGGKTGYTDEAGPSMSVIAKMPNDKHVIIVVLNAQDREAEIIKIFNWIKKAYNW